MHSTPIVPLVPAGVGSTWTSQHVFLYTTGPYLLVWVRMPSPRATQSIPCAISDSNGAICPFCSLSLSISCLPASFPFYRGDNNSIVLPSHSLTSTVLSASLTERQSVAILVAPPVQLQVLTNKHTVLQAIEKRKCL